MSDYKHQPTSPTPDQAQGPQPTASTTQAAGLSGTLAGLQNTLGNAGVRGMISTVGSGLGAMGGLIGDAESLISGAEDWIGDKITGVENWLGGLFGTTTNGTSDPATSTNQTDPQTTDGDKTTGDPGHDLSEVPGADTLDLGANERYRDAILLAAQRTGLDPAAIASVISAEAGHMRGDTLNATTDADFYKAHPELNGRPLTDADVDLKKEWAEINKKDKAVWDPSSKATSTSAEGLTQFLSGTWTGEAERSGTYLNQHAKELGLVDANNKIISGKEAEVLALRDDPTMSIVAGAEYDKHNLDQLEAAGLVPADATDDQRAQYMYYTHHEGLGGAKAMLNGTIPEDRANNLLAANVLNQADRDALIQQNGSAAAAYEAWLKGYTADHIVPSNFRKAATTTP